MIWNMDSCCR